MLAAVDLSGEVAIAQLDLEVGGASAMVSTGTNSANETANETIMPILVPTLPDTAIAAETPEPSDTVMAFPSPAPSTTASVSVTVAHPPVAVDDAPVVVPRGNAAANVGRGGSGSTDGLPEPESPSAANSPTRAPGAQNAYDPVAQLIDERLREPVQPARSSGFMSRYADAIEEFEARRSAVSEPDNTPPPPTDDEMARYNESLHRWLDADARRIAAEGVDDGGYANTGRSPLFAVDNGVFPGSSTGTGRAPFQTLGGVQEMPGLGEGLRRLSL